MRGLCIRLYNRTLHACSDLITWNRREETTRVKTKYSYTLWRISSYEMGSSSGHYENCSEVNDSVSVMCKT